MADTIFALVDCNSFYCSCERVALLTFRQSGRLFEAQCKMVEDIYALRSGYVDAGIEIRDDRRLKELRSLCEQVFRCLMRLQTALPKAERGEIALRN